MSGLVDRPCLTDFGPSDQRHRSVTCSSQKSDVGHSTKTVYLQTIPRVLSCNYNRHYPSTTRRTHTVTFAK